MKKSSQFYFFDATRTTFSGLLAFIAGLIGGAFIYEYQLSYHLGDDEWIWCFVAWLWLIPHALNSLWCLLLLPFLAFMFFGLIWKEWNRFTSTIMIALVFSSALLLTDRLNPFRCFGAIRDFLITTGSALVLLVVAIIWDKLTTRTPD